MKTMSWQMRFGRAAGLGLLVLMWLGLAASPALGAPPTKTEKAPFSTMAEVLAALGKPEAIVYAKHRATLEGDDSRNIVALRYRKPHKQEFFISRTGRVVPANGYFTLPAQAIDPALSAALPRKSVADVCRRYGNPDAVWPVGYERLQRTPLTVQLTFEKAKMRYQFSSDGYALVGFAISDDLQRWRGKDVADVFRELGKPNWLTHPDDFSTRFQVGSPRSSVVLIYPRYRDRRWYVLPDGKLFTISENKLEAIEEPTPDWDDPDPHHQESIADWVNRHGRPDRIEAIVLPERRGTPTVIALTYRGINRPICFSPKGYLLDKEGNCPTDRSGQQAPSGK